MYWLPKLHKQPFKFCFISATSKCPTTSMSVLLTYTLTTIKQLVNFCDKINKHSAINNCWSVKNSVVLHMPSSRDSVFDSVDSYDFLVCNLSILYLPNIEQNG